MQSIPLFYTSQNNLHYEAHSLRALIEKLPNKPNFNHHYLKNYLHRGLWFLHDNNHETCYENIFCVPFGFTLKNNKLIKAFSLKKEDLKISKNDAQEKFLYLLKKSVASVTEHYDSIGLELSGGLDSSTVTALTRLVCPEKKLFSFSHSPEKPSDLSLSTLNAFEKFQFAFDEYYFAKSTADKLGIPLIALEKNFDFHSIIEKTTDILRCFSEVSFPILASTLYDQAKSQGVKLILSGYGGDEMVTQSGLQRLSELRRHHHWIQYSYEKLRRKKAKMPPLENTLSSDHLPFLKFPVTSFAFPTFDSIEKREKLLLESDVAVHCTRRIQTSQIIAAHYGIQQAFPLLNPELLQFFHQLPSHFKYCHGTSRYLIRKTMRPYLPKNVITRREKNGRMASLSEYIKQLPTLFCDRVPVHYNGILSEYIDIPALRKHIENGYGYESNITRLSLMVMMFIHLEKWLAMR